MLKTIKNQGFILKSFPSQTKPLQKNRSFPSPLFIIYVDTRHQGQEQFKTKVFFVWNIYNTYFVNSYCFLFPHTISTIYIYLSYLNSKSFLSLPYGQKCFACLAILCWSEVEIGRMVSGDFHSSIYYKVVNFQTMDT